MEKTAKKKYYSIPVDGIPESALNSFLLTSNRDICFKYETPCGKCKEKTWTIVKRFVYQKVKRRGKEGGKVDVRLKKNGQPDRRIRMCGFCVKCECDTSRLFGAGELMDLLMRQKAGEKIYLYSAIAGVPID